MTWTLLVEAPRYKLQRSVLEEEINGYWESQIQHIAVNTGNQLSVIEVTGDTLEEAVKAVLAYEPEVKLKEILKTW